ncbi:L,D-transpeptidase [Enterococcus gilvus]|uniref:L,D-transpeptidase n=1 Tax=Enterococcus gilvus TaxID=160453 RepID=UPI003EDAB2E9
MKKSIRIICVCSVLLMCFFAISNKADNRSNSDQKKNTNTVSSHKVNKKKYEEKIDWRKPSENKPYPSLTMEDYVLVDTKKNRAYIKNGNKVLYTMYCSTGSEKSPTPTGEFTIQERGEHFYNYQSGEGANYYVSFKDHGVYLFHSVPVDENGDYIESEASELGKSSNSHGCVRLSVPDAKWFYENAIEGMKVEII